MKLIAAAKVTEAVRYGQGTKNVMIYTKMVGVGAKVPGQSSLLYELKRIIKVRLTLLKIRICDEKGRSIFHLRLNECRKDGGTDSGGPVGSVGSKKAEEGLILIGEGIDGSIPAYDEAGACCHCRSRQE